MTRSSAWPELRTPSHAARIVLVTLGALIFGTAAALLEGKSGGHGAVAEVRNSVGNLSTPYLLIAFVAGTMCARMRTGALTGLAATMSALLGYYLVSALVQAGDSGFAEELRSILSANRGYIQGGVGMGLAFGALGAWWERRRRLSASIVAGALLMAEPLALLMLGVLGPDELAGEGVPTVLRLVPGWGLTLDRGAIPLAVYAMEFLAGLGLVILAAWGAYGGTRAAAPQPD